MTMPKKVQLIFCKSTFTIGKWKKKYSKHSYSMQNHLNNPSYWGVVKSAGCSRPRKVQWSTSTALFDQTYNKKHYNLNSEKQFCMG